MYLQYYMYSIPGHVDNVTDVKWGGCMLKHLLYMTIYYMTYPVRCLTCLDRYLHI